MDKGFISFDATRNLIVFRQFNIEGYVNRYVLDDSLSNELQLVFVTEAIENFMPGGEARWTIKKKYPKTPSKPYSMSVSPEADIPVWGPIP